MGRPSMTERKKSQGASGRDSVVILPNFRHGKSPASFVAHAVASASRHVSFADDRKARCVTDSKMARDNAVWHHTG